MHISVCLYVYMNIYVYMCLYMLVHEYVHICTWCIQKVSRLFLYRHLKLS